MYFTFLVRPIYRPHSLGTPLPDGFLGLAYRGWRVVSERPVADDLESPTKPNRIVFSKVGEPVVGPDLITTEYSGS